MFKTTILRIKVRKTHATSEPIVTHLPEKDDPERDVCRKVLKFIQKELSSLCPTDDKGVKLKTYILGTCCGSFHNVNDFNSDVLPCGMEGMDITRYRRLLGDDNQPELAGVSDLPTHTAEEVEEPGAQYARLGEEASSTRASQPQFPTGQPSTLSGFTASVYSTENLNGLIFAVSRWWEDEDKNVNMLKVLLREFISSVGDLEEKDNPYDLLNLLIGPGVVKTSDVNVIIEVAFLSDLQGVESKIMTHVPSFLGFSKFRIHKFSSHRRNLIEFGKKLRSKTTRIIANMCGIRQTNADKWVLIFKLEAKNFLTKEGKDAFIQQLKENGMVEEAKALNTYQ